MSFSPSQKSGQLYLYSAFNNTDSFKAALQWQQENNGTKFVSRRKSHHSPA